MGDFYISRSSGATAIIFVFTFVLQDFEVKGIHFLGLVNVKSKNFFYIILRAIETLTIGLLTSKKLMLTKGDFNTNLEMQ